MQKHVLLAAVAAAALLAAPAAFAAEKQTPPEGGPAKAFKLPAVQTFTLPNGAKVTLIPYGNAPKANVRAVVRVGNLNDGEQPMIADYVASMMTEGAGARDSKALALAAAAMGGDLSTGAGMDETFVDIDVLSEKTPDAIALVADVLAKPALPDSEFARIQQNMLRNLSISASQPAQIASNAFYGNLYPDHPYGRILPPIAKVAAIKNADVKAFHAANFGAARTHLYVVGRFDPKKAKSAAMKALAALPKGAEPLNLPPGEAAPAVLLVDRPGAVQSTVRLGRRVPPIDGSLELEAADTLLGGYFSSRITRNIREDKGYTYSPTSFVNANYKVANWQQNADITSEATGPAIGEIVKEVRRLQNEPPSEAEVKGIKNYMSGVFVIGLASRQGLLANLAQANLHGLGLSYLEDYVGKTAKITGADMQNATKTHLGVDKMSLVVVGDMKSVRKQLEALPDFKDRLPPPAAAAK
jgi:predicted Zn-dependent peptidase